jgi:hypothetical protein
MAYVRPQNVLAPQNCWQLRKILFDGGESEEHRPPEKWSLAAGHWQGDPCLVIRLNGCGKKTGGYPVAYGRAAWVVLPTELNQFALSLLPSDRRAGTNHCLPEGRNVICWPSASVTDTEDEYVAPEKVRPQTGPCRLDRVLIDQGESPVDHRSPAKFSIALGSWVGQPRLLLRWNGVPATKHAKGMPLAGSRPNWFPLPIECSTLVLEESR